jgi:TonB family protein
MRTKLNSKGVAGYAPTHGLRALFTAIFAVAITFTFTACEAASGKSALVGRWQLVEGRGLGGMELLNDGTGIVNGEGITWKVEKDRFYVTGSSSAFSCSYKISGSVLKLIMDNGDVAILNKIEKCGDEWYNLVWQSCKGNKIVNDKCNEKVYNPKTEYCIDSTLKKIPTPTVTYGSVTHGGQTYKTVKIGEQTWMAENLNYNAEGSKCYDNKPANCEKYGRLYNWATAMKACPSGWHLPSDEEWDKLYRFADGTNGTESRYSSRIAYKFLKSKEGWDCDPDEICGNGIDVFGFSALPGGCGFPDGGFARGGNGGSWWSSSEDKSFRKYAYDRDMGSIWFNGDKIYFYSVRCVQDKGSLKALSASDIDMGNDDAPRSKQEIMQVVNDRMTGLSNIYNKYLKLKPSFSGKVTLKFTIAPSGDIVSIAIVSSTTDYSEFDNAVKIMVSTWKWEQIRSGDTTPIIPFSFTE